MSTATMRVNVREDYRAFLRAKVTPGVQFDGDEAIFPALHFASSDSHNDDIATVAPHLHEYQRFATAFALSRQRAALFLECGLGKTSIALAWLPQVARDRPAVICAPMAALHEFEAEQRRFFPGVPLALVQTRDFDAWLSQPQGIALVTHHAFTRDRDLSAVSAFVLDESSILKSGGDGAIASALTRSCRQIPNRMALSATPAPNDPTEFAAHATWLGYMRSDAEFRARFFVRDGNQWRVKGHATTALPQWLARFALWIRDPAAYGMPCSSLPSEDYNTTVVSIDEPALAVDVARDLFGAPAGAIDMSQRSAIRRELYESEERTRQVVELIRGHSSIVWTIRNGHADALEKAIRAAGLRVAQIAGATDDEARQAHLQAFRAGELDVLVSKPAVIGHGVNLQHADRMVFAGYDESYEAMHQAIRRAHRQGRTGQLEVFFLAAPEERKVLATLRDKAETWARDTEQQQSAFVSALANDLTAYKEGAVMEVAHEHTDRLADVKTPYFWMQNGDSIELMETMEADSVDMAVFSPPFAALFTYSSESADMGNCSDQAEEEFALHFRHFAAGLLRVMKPGRVVCLHLAQLVAFRSRHGRKGVRDFRGSVIAVMEDEGFHFYGEFVIPKNPQAVAIRTKTERLQFVQFKRDSLESSPSLNDFVLEFRKPGTQEVPVHNDVSNEEWIRWASGVWGDINESDVLGGWHSARAENDEKHICPLQLTVIERCVRLWSNPGEVVFSPFAGIGSEVYTAIRQGRVGWGIELKGEYFRQAVKNAELAVHQTHEQMSVLPLLAAG